MSTVLHEPSLSGSSSPPMLLPKELTRRRYRNCHYHNGKFCCTKVCTVVVLLVITTCISLILTSLAIALDNWAGVSSNPDATMDLPYPHLGNNYLDYVMFNDTIPNDDSAMYKYIDSHPYDVTLRNSRIGILSNCKGPTYGPKVALYKSPWKAPVCTASYDEYQCPIIAMRVTSGKPPKSPGFFSSNGCIKKSKLCDGEIDCPSGHDELNCNKEIIGDCGPNMIQCSAEKQVCIEKEKICDGINDCGMYEDEKNCCGKDGFIRCNDGSCLLGVRCDGVADCFDRSDEYCSAASNELFMCSDGQLIESVYRCDGMHPNAPPSFQCTDLSDETECNVKAEPQWMNPAIKTPVYDKKEKCFKEEFTFYFLNQTMMEANYPDAKQRDLMSTYELSPTKLAVLVSLCIAVALYLICLLLLFSISKCTKRCQSMRCCFIALAIIYMSCTILTLFAGVFWVKYVNAINDVMDSMIGLNIQDQVHLQTIQTTGALASIRISTHLAFYNCGFLALAVILSIIASRCIKKASCHTGSVDFSQHSKYKMYSEEFINPDDMLLPSGYRRTDNSIDSDVPTPEQIVTPKRSFSSGQHANMESTNGSLLRNNGQGGTVVANGGTYVSYKDPLDSLDRADKLSYISIRTLERGKRTQV